MTDRFDEIIHGSRPDMPDPADYRRLNRVPLRKPVKRFSGLPKPGHSFVIVAACLAVVVLLSGQTSELVSHDWELVSETGTTGVGTETVWHTDPITGRTFNNTGTEEEIRGWQQAYAAQDGKLTEVTFLGYGEYVCWLFHAEFNVNGITEPSILDDPPGFPCGEMPGLRTLLENYGKDMNLRKNIEPPHETFVIHAYGHEILMESWNHQYPGFGEVTFARSSRLVAN